MSLGATCASSQLFPSLQPCSKYSGVQAFHSSIVRLCWTLQVEGIAQVDSLTKANRQVITIAVPVVHYQYGDHLGSSVVESNELGQVISYEEYYPYGVSAYRAAASGVGLSLKRYQFTGKERDEETRLDYTTLHTTDKIEAMKLLFCVMSFFLICSCLSVSNKTQSSSITEKYIVLDTIDVSTQCTERNQKVFIVRDTNDIDELKPYLVFTKEGSILNIVDIPNGQDFNGFVLSHFVDPSGFVIRTSWGTICKINSKYHIVCSEDDFYVSNVYHERYNCDTLGGKQLDTFLVNLPLNDYRINPWIEEEYSTYRKYLVHKGESGVHPQKPDNQ